jgi:AcrR family transcriptional regulator
MSAGPGRKRGRPVDEEARKRKSADILVAAARVFARHGYASTDVQRIADEVGVGKGTLYLYFRSKEELFWAAVEQGLTRLEDRVNGAAQTAEDPLEKTERAIRAYLAFFHEHPEYAELFIQERAEFRDRKKLTYFAHGEANACPWKEMYRAVIAQGRLRDVPVERIMDVLGDLVYGTMFTNHLSGRNKPLQDQARDIIDIVFHGILSDSERARRAGT